MPEGVAGGLPIQDGDGATDEQAGRDHSEDQLRAAAAAAVESFGLTRREQEVFSLLVRGKPHKQIAYELGISERTVKLHRHQLLQKLEVRSLAESAVIAERLGLLPRDRAVMGAGVADAERRATDTLR